MVEKSKPTKTSPQSTGSSTKNLTSTEVKTVGSPASSKSVQVKNGKHPAQLKAATPKDNKQQKTTKPGKSIKQKLIRDSFTLPENDYANLSILKAKCLQNGVEVKKSELVRAGLTALTKMSVAALVKAVAEVDKLKTGRPKGE